LNQLSQTDAYVAYENGSFILKLFGSFGSEANLPENYIVIPLEDRFDGRYVYWNNTAQQWEMIFVEQSTITLFDTGLSGGDAEEDLPEESE
jgi:hypothetical protein